jgi:hypothetical protein
LKFSSPHALLAVETPRETESKITMQANDPNVKWVEEPRLGLTGKMYLPLLFQGLTTTTKHLLGPKVTVSFPEVRPTIE